MAAHANRPLPSRDRIAKFLRYDPATGALTWISRRGVRAGRVAGCVSPDDYRRVGFDMSEYLAHRLVWALHHDEVPEFLDHINGDKDDNRIENLRPASKSENGMNRSKQRNNVSGVKGVCWDTRKGRWLATIKKEGKQVRLGHFSDPEAAHAAYAKAAQDLHGQFARLA